MPETAAVSHKSLLTPLRGNLLDGDVRHFISQPLHAIFLLSLGARTASGILLVTVNGLRSSMDGFDWPG